ncbi:MAG TPA: hypothetical protein VGN93_14470 [Shinella sp.]|jgi:hypothetical protein|uniref:hypothetical protein n=1 Tax=Shinella sp. TaxID=1870904 RepID=UPI002E135C69|nr:hypothetical protein [Shinella sp.]
MAARMGKNSTDIVDAVPNDDEALDCGETVGRGVLDKLLLAIIDANTEPAASDVAAQRRRSDRLREARVALLGQSNPEGRPPASDEAILRWIGNQHYRDRARHDMAKIMNQTVPKGRSDRKLIEAAIKHFHLPENAHDRLKKKWRTARQKWLDVAMYHDDVPEALDINLLEAVQKALLKDGVSMELSNIGR